MTQIIIALLLVAFGWALGRYGFAAMRAWVLGAAAAVAAGWESVQAFIGGLLS